MTNRNSPEPAGKDLGSRCRRGTNGVVWPQFSCLSNGLIFASHCQDPETRLGRGAGEAGRSGQGSGWGSEPCLSLPWEGPWLSCPAPGRGRPAGAVRWCPPPRLLPLLAAPREEEGTHWVSYSGWRKGNCISLYPANPSRLQRGVCSQGGDFLPSVLGPPLADSLIQGAPVPPACSPGPGRVCPWSDPVLGHCSWMKQLWGGNVTCL